MKIFRLNVLVKTATSPQFCCRTTLRNVSVKTATSPQFCCRSTLRNVSGQPYRFTAQLIQFRVMQRCLITVRRRSYKSQEHHLHYFQIRRKSPTQFSFTFILLLTPSRLCFQRHFWLAVLCKSYMTDFHKIPWKSDVC